MTISKIDLSNVSDDELDQIHNDVLRRLAQRAKSGPVPDEPHDSHSSSHSKNTVQIKKPAAGTDIIGGVHSKSPPPPPTKK